MGEIKNFVKRNKVLANRGVKLACPDRANIRRIVAEITRPEGGEIHTPFDGKTLKLAMDIPNDYPNRAPKCRFQTYVFHPNIRWSTGEVCLNILTDPADWANDTTLDQVVCYIEELLALPNCDSPYNCDASSLVRDGDLRAYRSLVDYYLALSAQRELENASSGSSRLGNFGQSGSAGLPRGRGRDLGLPEGTIIYDEKTDNYYMID